MIRFFFSTFCLLLLGTTAPAAVVYSGVQNVSIPFGVGEVYVNVITNANTSSYPGDFETAPWIVAFFGGSGIGTGPLIRTVVTGSVVAGAEQTANLAPGTVVNSMSRFSIGDAGFNGSETHTGAAINQFQLGTQGYIGYEFEPTVSGPSYFGVMRITVDNLGGALIHDWFYESTPGAAIFVPEPSRTLLLLAGICAMLQRRRKQFTN